MSVVRNAGSTCPAIGMDGALPPPTWECRTARCTAQWGPSAAVVTAHGELDASNAAQMVDYVQRCTIYSKWLILDLSGLEFFGTAGFSALQMINVRCADARAHWAVVPSRAVSRLLRICDPDKALPMAESEATVVAMQKEPQRLLQLVSQSR
jgi:anti-anti-sigma factor